MRYASDHCLSTVAVFWGSRKSSGPLFFWSWKIVAPDAATATTLLSQGKIPYLLSCFNATFKKPFYGIFAISWCFISEKLVFPICETEHLSCTEPALAVFLATLDVSLTKPLFMWHSTIFFVCSCAKLCREVSVPSRISVFSFSLFAEWQDRLYSFPPFMFLGFCC